MRNTLQVAGSTSKADFACGLIRGLGGNLSLADRTAFAKEVSGERNNVHAISFHVIFYTRCQYIKLQ